MTISSKGGRSRKSAVYPFILCLSLILSAVGFGESPSEPRVFTRASDQKTLKGKVTAYDGETVTLKISGKEHKLDPEIFTADDRQFFEDWKIASLGLPPVGELDPRVMAGESFRVEMPGLAETFTGKTAGFTVSIPKNYTYAEPVPLMIFLNGGTGSETLRSAKKIDAADRYVIASFPYTSEIDKDGPLGHVESNMKLIEAYHTAMLQQLHKLVPNLSKTHRVLIGSSNGAHIIGSAIAMDWECYLGSFPAYVLWEGGGSISKDFSAAKGKKYIAWAGWGGKSESREFMKGIADALDDSRVKVTKEEVPSAGHSPNPAALAAMQRWLSEIATPAMDKMAEEAR